MLHLLDKKTKTQILNFVYKKPRTIQEIAIKIQKNWRTADSYIKKIKDEEGTLETRTFREGTRGALKIVYHTSIEKISSNEFQENLYKKIENGKKKQDFSPFDIFQYVEEKKRSATKVVVKKENETYQDLAGLLKTAQHQLLLFSGNLSWINFKQDGKPMLEVLEEVAEHVSIKILCRVDFAGLDNIKKVLSINDKIGKRSIRIRHCEQPLRAFVVDKKIARFKETKDPDTYKEGELKNKLLLLYEIYDDEWLEWLEKVFFKLFRTSISSKKRIKILESIVVNSRS